MKKKFYHEGINFSCTNCGNCCKIKDGWVEMNEEELEDASTLLGVGTNKFNRKYIDKKSGSIYLLKTKADDSCIFLDENNRCTIYSARPGHCRTFPFWPENLKSIYRWEKTKENCPGIGTGDHYPLEQIKDILTPQRKSKK